MFVISILLTVFVIDKQSQFYATFCGFLIPIIIAFTIEYDRRMKIKFQEFYLPLIFYIRTYFDILYQNDEYMNHKEKHQTIVKLSDDLYNFVKNNIRFMSKDLSYRYGIQFMHYYNNSDEMQKNHDLIGIAPIIFKEVNEIYWLLHINEWFKRNKFIKKERYLEITIHKCLFNECFILKKARDLGMIDTIHSTILFCNAYFARESSLEEKMNLFKYTSKRFKNLNYQGRFHKESKITLEQIQNELKDKYNLDLKEIK